LIVHDNVHFLCDHVWITFSIPMANVTGFPLQ